MSYRSGPGRVPMPVVRSQTVIIPPHMAIEPAQRVDGKSCECYHPSYQLYTVGRILRQAPTGYATPWRQRVAEQGDEQLDDDGATPALRIERRFLKRASRLVREANPEATIFFNSRLRPDRFPELGSRAERRRVVA